MRGLFLALLASLLCSASFAQLVADAGPDAAWCYEMQPDTPALGGKPTARGGLPPYSYHWTMSARIPIGPGRYLPVDEYYFLNTPDSAAPKLRTFFYYADSLLACLKITDSLGQEAFDTAVVYFNNAIVYPWTPTVYKAADDTITLPEDLVYSDAFGGYHDFMWSPGAFLDDSTVRLPRCYTPVPQRYVLAMTNRIGCRLYGTNIQVYIYPAGIGSVYSKEPEPVIMLARDEVIVRTGGLPLPCRLRVFDLKGRVVLNKELLRPDNAIPLPSGLSAGLYVYALRSAKGACFRGKLGLQ